jgi:hypothetical protein
MTSSSNMTSASTSNGALTVGKAILWGGLVAGVLDATDGVIFYGLQGLNPIQVLQYIASGALGQSAFQGGLATAALGAGFHFLIAFVAATTYVLVAGKVPVLKSQAIPLGLLFGVTVFAFMNYGVLPFSKVAPSAFTWAWFLNGAFGHALFVGLPISLFARRTAN